LHLLLLLVLLQVPHTGSETWTAAIHRKKQQPTAAAADSPNHQRADDDFADEDAAEAAAAGIVAPWQPWYNSQQPAQVAGYVVEYDSGLTYATVKGAGEASSMYCDRYLYVRGVFSARLRNVTHKSLEVSSSPANTGAPPLIAS
jgi:predicted metalloprotease